MNVIDYECQCGSCKGTGLYVGRAERDGIAVVCTVCGGTGKRSVHIEYETFTGRVPREGITRVVECNPGIMVGRSKDGSVLLSDFGGMPYEEWKNDLPFPPKSEMRRFTCPAWWYQSADYSRKPDWTECNATWGSSFSQCPYFATRSGCWERFDREQGEKK